MTATDSGFEEGAGAARRGWAAGAPGDQRYLGDVDPLRAFRSVDDAAAVAAGMVASEARLQDVWRHAVVQLLDDYESVRRHEGLSAVQAMWAVRPRRSGDRRVDAAFAALGEYLARRDGWPSPAWVRDPELEAVPWWFVTALRGLHPQALVESPLSFRKRGVFITSGALKRA
ncbi:MAG: hypothetical protein ACQSGP_25720 [Frankia sp.]